MILPRLACVHGKESHPGRFWSISNSPWHNRWLSSRGLLIYIKSRSRAPRSTW